MSVTIGILLFASTSARGQTSENPAPSKESAAPTASFSKFIARVETESNELEVTALFTLGEHSNGINPLNQDVTLKVGDFSNDIPTGSFKTSSIGWFKYEGVINGVDLEVKIVPLGANRYGFRAEAAAKGLMAPAPGQSKVELSIGDNTGSTTAKVERSWI
jgi:hypothetical protein